MDPTGEGLHNFLPYLAGEESDDPYVCFHVCRLQSDGMTEEEKALPRFTRKNLMTLSNWAEWDDAHDRQLDAHHAAGTFGAPVIRPGRRPDGRRLNFRVVWTNIVKAGGTRKSRSCLDGSVRAAPGLRQSTQTYSSCIEHCCQRLFFALATRTNKIVTYADTENAFDPMMFVIATINCSMACCSHHIAACFIIAIGAIKVIRMWIATLFSVVTLSYSFLLTALPHQKSSTSF
jgi:hypothetical protein